MARTTKTSTETDLPPAVNPGQNGPDYVAPTDTDTPVQAPEPETPVVVTDADLPQGNPEPTEASVAVDDAIPTLPQGQEPTTDASFEAAPGERPAVTEFEREQRAHAQETREIIMGSNAFDEMVHEVAGPMPKDLLVSPDHPLHANVRDVVTFGDSDTWQLLCKASSRSQGWMKTTKAMDLNGTGVLVQTETQQRNADGSYSLSQSVVFVPGVRIVDVTEDVDGEPKLTGRKLMRTH